MNALILIAFGLTASLFATGASAQPTLQSVKQKGFLTCGSNTGLAGFGLPDTQGNWTGLDVDFCRAIAAAIFNDPTKVRFIPLSAKDRFTALQSGEVDVLVRNTTWTMSRDTQLGLDFTGVNYTTARASSCARSSASPRRRSSTAPRSARSKAPRPSSTSPTSSAPTT